MLAKLVSGDSSKVLDGVPLGGPITLREMRGGGWCGSVTAEQFGERLPERLITMVVVLSYLDRLLDPLTDTLTLETATALLGLRADADIVAHIEELRRKANEGSLTSAEDAEYKDFIEAVDVVSIMQAKARSFLSRQAA
jgi:hypothetical protein